MESETSLTWSGYEYAFRHRSPDWYWALAILALAGATTAFIFNNALFAIIILLGAFVLALHAAKKPTSIQFTVTERGILINRALYPFETLDSFWVSKEEDTPEPRLIVKSKKIFMPYIVLPLTVPHEKIEEFLLLKLKKEEHHEPMAHRLMEYVGF
ncbi:MAG TPA: hypothetical protein VJI74_01035 [Candidatus Paceibacterota bacterium]